MAIVDFFLKLDGIDGESSDAKHKGEIDVLSWSFGATQQGTGTGSYSGGSGAGKVNMQDMHFTAYMSKASPKLMLACASGQHIKTGTLICRKAGGDQQEYLKIVLSDVLITSYQTGGSHTTNGGVVPTDQFSLNFGKIEKEYKEQKPDGTLGGSVKTGWNLRENKKV